MSHRSSGKQRILRTALFGYDEAMDETPGHRDHMGGAPSCVGALAGDLGWGLGVVLRAYATAAHTAVADLPGGPRGYQILSAAARLFGTQRFHEVRMEDIAARAGVSSSGTSNLSSPKRKSNPRCGRSRSARCARPSSG